MRFYLTTLLVFGLHFCNSQQTYYPGPADLDTNRLSHVYIFRLGTDPYEKFWFGIIQHNHSEISCKVNKGQVYRINTAITGRTKFWSGAGKRTSVTLDLVPGNNYYIDCDVYENDLGKMDLRLRELSNETGERKLKSFWGKVKERNCEIPISPNTDYITDLYPGELRWVADDKQVFKFPIIPIWETIKRSEEITAYGYFNKIISPTYSSEGGIIHLSKLADNSQDAFDHFLKDSLQQFGLGNFSSEKDSIISYESAPIDTLANILHATRVYEVSKYLGPQKRVYSSPLYIHTLYYYFSWVDNLGQIRISVLHVGERGLPTELRSKEILQQMADYSWSKLQLIDK